MTKAKPVINTKSAVFRIIILAAVGAIAIYTAQYIKNTKSMNAASSAFECKYGEIQSRSCKLTATIYGTQERRCVSYKNGLSKYTQYAWSYWGKCHTAAR